MPPHDADILHVSDTALMVAACRAIETARPDGLVRDPFAGRLAGERGMAIARALPRLDIMSFAVGIRARFLDELVAGVFQVRKVETVLSLGSGLDTRPWRLDLPAGLRWMEVDFPAMLDYKSGMLAGHPANCRVERMAADLNDPSGRRALFAAAGGAPALMITEGLLMYLPAETVEALAVEPARWSGVQYWLMDLTSREAARRVGMDPFQSIQKVRAETHLDGAETIEVLERTGWSRLESRSYRANALAVAPERIKALIGARHASEPPPPLPDDASGVHLFGRAPVQSSRALGGRFAWAG